MKKEFYGVLSAFLLFWFQLTMSCFGVENNNIITFEDVLKQAKNFSYNIQIADYEVFIAKQGVRTARSEYFPKINASIGTEYTKNFKDFSNFIHTTSKIDAKLGAKLFKHLFRLYYTYFENRQVGNIAARVRELDRIREFITDKSVSDNAPTYNRSENNLIINYGDDDSITIANYFKSKNPSIEAVNYKIYDEEEDGYVNKTDNLNDSIIIKGQPDYTYGYKTYYYEGNEKNNLIYANSKADEIDTGDGNNTVYINSKVEAGVYGGSGDDTYHVNSLKSYVWLNDADGADKLVINEKASNINVIFEVNTTGGPIMDPYSSMLVLNDSAYNKHKKINFKIDPENINSGIQVTDGDSSIEYIYSKDNKMIDIAQLKGQVEGWLSNNGYTSAMQVLDYEKTDGDIEILLGIYQDAWQDVVV